MSEVQYMIVAGTEGKYRVGNDGSVWSQCWGSWRKLNDRFGPAGYLMVAIHQKNRQVHHLILEAFVGPRPEGAICRHLDGNKLNNRPENLAWGTTRENTDDKMRHDTVPKGEKHWNTTLTTELVLQIRADRAAGHRLKDIGEKYKQHPSVIGDVVHRRTWKHVK